MSGRQHDDIASKNYYEETGHEGVERRTLVAKGKRRLKKDVLGYERDNMFT